MRNAAIDLAAAKDRGVVVSGTGSNPYGTAELTWALILGLARNVAAEDAAVRAGGARLVGKDELFATAKIVTLHLVLADSTRRIVDDAALRSMRPDAFLVNTSRGPLVDQVALRQALEDGRIAGAGLDVYDVEPLPPDHWVHAAPRTLLTPHLGYVTGRGYQVFYGEVVEDIRAYLDGAPVRVL